MLNGTNINASRTLAETINLLILGVNELEFKISTMDLNSLIDRKLINDDLSFIKRIYEKLEMGSYTSGDEVKEILPLAPLVSTTTSRIDVKVRGLLMWTSRCKENLTTFREYGSRIPHEERTDFISRQYALLSSIMLVLEGKAKISGIDLHEFEEATEEAVRDRWEHSRREYYDNPEN
jgi:hypothetical protein